jgi:hypothetical protein
MRAGDGGEGAGDGAGKNTGEVGGNGTAVAVRANVPNSLIFRFASFRSFVPRLCRFNFPFFRAIKYKIPFSCRPMFFSMVFTPMVSFLWAKEKGESIQTVSKLDTARGDS